MTVEEMNKRKLSHKRRGDSLFNNLPKTDDIIIVVYSDYDNIFVFDSAGLSDGEKVDLVNRLIGQIQLGTYVTREIVKIVGNVYFVY